MASRLTPARRRGHEYLDEPGIDPRIVQRSLAEVALSNALFGGTRAVLRELDRALVEEIASATLLDVGTGAGDIPSRARQRAEARGIRLTTVGVDLSETLVASNRPRIGMPVRADALSLPFADASFDIVTCSQTLHHFDDADSRRVVRELDRVARTRVIVSDLRRSWFAAAGIWVASFPLGFHPVSRHDGVVSVMRGFTVGELHDIIRDAIGHRPTVIRRLGFRVTASWSPPGFGSREWRVGTGNREPGTVNSESGSR
jgi:SAM-dependent methyltransferase